MDRSEFEATEKNFSTAPRCTSPLCGPGPKCSRITNTPSPMTGERRRSDGSCCCRKRRSPLRHDACGFQMARPGFDKDRFSPRKRRPCCRQDRSSSVSRSLFVPARPFLAETSSFPRGEGSLFVDPRVAIRFGKNDPGQTRIVPRRQGNFPCCTGDRCPFRQGRCRSHEAHACVDERSLLVTDGTLFR